MLLVSSTSLQAQSVGVDRTTYGHVQASFIPAACDVSIVPLHDSSYMDAFHFMSHYDKPPGKMAGDNSMLCYS